LSDLTSRKDALKALLKRLHAGEDMTKMKGEIGRTLGDLTPAEITQIGEELTKEGTPELEVQRLRDVHLALFQETLVNAQPIAPVGHPIHILMAEHRRLLEIAVELRNSVAQGDYLKAREIAGQFKTSDRHYLREENVLFPYLEKHGVTQPPKMMWLEHDQLRGIEKRLYAAVDLLRPSFDELAEAARALSELLSNHFFKENNILFPTAMKMFEAAEWDAVRSQFVEIGWCPFTPPQDIAQAGVKPAPEKGTGTPTEVTFETGSLPRDVLEAVLDRLPVDISFVDPGGKVRYFSNAPDRIFTRTKAVIGRSVQNCHPPKSLPAVNQILDDFQQGRRNDAEFWLNLGGKMVHIRYFAVRDKAGKYLGCLEVSQDITHIRKLEGEKRLA
jgi:PAS domain S-box-containing protein